MPRLIDADELFNAFEKNGWYDSLDRDDVAEELLLKAPTVDAVEVVRCEDCLFFEHYWCSLHENTMYDNDFCSYGERKDGDSDGRQT